MIVLDASTIVAALVDAGDGGERARDELRKDPEWAVSAHGVIEVANALRGLWLGGQSTDEEFRQRLDLVARMELMPFAISPLLTRIGELGHNATAYDAAYLALAEAMNVQLVTLDGKLADIPGSRARVQVLV